MAQSIIDWLRVSPVSLAAARFRARASGRYGRFPNGGLTRISHPTG